MGGEGGARARVTPRASATGARGSRRQARTRRVAREEGRATHLARRERPRARRGNEGGRGLFSPRNDGDPSRAIVRIFVRILQRAFSLSKTHAHTWVRTAPGCSTDRRAGKIGAKNIVRPRFTRAFGGRLARLPKRFDPTRASLRLSRPPPSLRGAVEGAAARPAPARGRKPSRTSRVRRRASPPRRSTPRALPPSEASARAPRPDVFTIRFGRGSK
jgi:hypothetical protein